MDAALDLGQQRARGKNTKPGNTFCELGSVYRRGKGSIYAPGGDDQVFWSEFCVAVHPWSGQRCEDAYSAAMWFGVWDGRLHKVKQGA